FLSLITHHLSLPLAFPLLHPEHRAREGEGEREEDEEAAGEQPAVAGVCAELLRENVGGRGRRRRGLDGADVQAGGRAEEEKDGRPEEPLDGSEHFRETSLVSRCRRVTRRGAWKVPNAEFGLRIE